MSCVIMYGYFGMGNVGDEAILSTLINEYESRGVKVYVVSADPKRSERIHHAISFRDRILSLSFLKNLAKCSEIVFAGGGKYGASTLKRISLLVLLAKLLGKKIRFRSVGLYPYSWSGSVSLYLKNSSDTFTRFLLRTALSTADVVTVRDIYSKMFVEGYIAGVNAKLELDPALKLKPDTTSAKKVLKDIGLDEEDTVIGLNIRFLRGKDFVRVLYNIVNALNMYLRMNAYVKVLFIPFGYGSKPDRFFDNDVPVGYMVKKYLAPTIRDRYYILEYELNPQTVLGVFRYLKAVICFRYHALLFAHVSRVPVLSIAYDTKVLEFAKLMKRLNSEILGIVVKPSDVTTELILSFLKEHVGM